MTSKELLQEFNTEYKNSYNYFNDHCDTFINDLMKKCALAFDQELQYDNLFKQAVIDFVEFRAGDPIKNDQERAAFYQTYVYFEFFY